MENLNGSYKDFFCSVREDDKEITAYHRVYCSIGITIPNVNSKQFILVKSGSCTTSSRSKTVLRNHTIVDLFNRLDISTFRSNRGYNYDLMFERVDYDVIDLSTLNKAKRFPWENDYPSDNTREFESNIREKILQSITKTFGISRIRKHGEYFIIEKKSKKDYEKVFSLISQIESKELADLNPIQAILNNLLSEKKLKDNIVIKQYEERLRIKISNSSQLINAISNNIEARQSVADSINSFFNGLFKSIGVVFGFDL